MEAGEGREGGVRMDAERGRCWGAAMVSRLQMQSRAWSHAVGCGGALQALAGRWSTGPARDHGEAQHTYRSSVLCSRYTASLRPTRRLVPGPHNPDSAPSAPPPTCRPTKPTTCFVSRPVHPPPSRPGGGAHLVQRGGNHLPDEVVVTGRDGGHVLRVQVQGRARARVGPRWAGGDGVHGWEQCFFGGGGRRGGPRQPAVHCSALQAVPPSHPNPRRRRTQHTITLVCSPPPPPPPHARAHIQACPYIRLLLP